MDTPLKLMQHSGKFIDYLDERFGKMIVVADKRTSPGTFFGHSRGVGCSSLLDVETLFRLIQLETKRNRTSCG